MVQPNRFLFSTRARTRPGVCVRARKGVGIQLDQLDHVGPYQLKYGFSKTPRAWNMLDHWVDQA